MSKNAAKKPKKPSNTTDLSRFADLVRAAKKTTAFEDLCNTLNLSPSACQKHIEAALEHGIKIKVKNNHVGLSLSPTPSAVHKVEVIPTQEVEPVVGGIKRVGVISDLHLGSMYCLRAQIKDFVNHAYEQGVRQILIPGDLLEGCYRHAAQELEFVGIEDQTQDFLDTLPSLEGLSYHAITGNHDWTFTATIGVDVGKFIQSAFARAGREREFFCYGDRGAFLVVEGAVVHLWHPGGGGSYAKSYKLQRRCEQYTSLKPQILLAGHWHHFGYVEERGIHAIACPTFQGGQSPFGKSRGGSPAIGGLILSWELTGHGTIRNFGIQKRSYFEIEEPVRIHNYVDGIAVPAKTKKRSP